MNVKREGGGVDIAVIFTCGVLHLARTLWTFVEGPTGVQEFIPTPPPLHEICI